MSDVVALLQQLVAIPSVSPMGNPPGRGEGEGEIARALVSRLRAAGFACEVSEGAPGRPNVVARLAGGDGPATIFEAHMDTVSAADMVRDPFAASLEHGRLFGRGACDDKAALAAMVVALEETARRGTPPGDIILAATADEEYSGSGVQHLIDQGLRADGAVVGEPTSLRLVVAHKGAVRLRITTHGLAAHSSEPDKGENAIYLMAPLIEALRGYAESLGSRQAHPLVGRPTCSIGTIHGGQAPNIVPSECSIVVDRRLLPDEQPEAAEAEVRAWLTQHCPGVAWEMSVMLYGIGMDTPVEAPIVGKCADALDRVLGGHEIAGVQYGTDASRLSRAGIPSVVLGPGDIAQAHTADEWVEVAQVEQAVAVYREIMWPS
ncbi:MAG: M20 family metallopeptidase [Armatimonadetes bacterium]|nr:M20 family metallopeptidase [Armatimonadota bacterium]